MTARVKEKMTQVRADEIVYGEPVRARTWRDILNQTNTVLGRGAQLIPAYYPGFQLTNGNPIVLRFRVSGRYQATQHRWTILAKASSGTCTLKVASSSGGTETEFHLQSPLSDASTIEFVEDVTQSEDEQTLDIELESSGGNADVLSIGCVEIPRAELSTSDDDDGIELTNANSGQPIYADEAGSTGFHKMTNVIAYPPNIGRRVGHFMWATPGSASNAKTTSSPGYTDMFDLDPPVLGRALDLDNSTSAAVTTTTLSCRFYAKASSGAEGHIRVQSSLAGDSVTITGITTTGYAWYPSTGSDPAKIAIKSEDLSDSSGLPSGSFESLDIDYKLASGAEFDLVYVASACFWEGGDPDAYILAEDEEIIAAEDGALMLEE